MCAFCGVIETLRACRCPFRGMFCRARTRKTTTRRGGAKSPRVLLLLLQYYYCRLPRDATCSRDVYLLLAGRTNGKKTFSRKTRSFWLFLHFSVLLFAFIVPPHLTPRVVPDCENRVTCGFRVVGLPPERPTTDPLVPNSKVRPRDLSTSVHRPAGNTGKRWFSVNVFWKYKILQTDNALKQYVIFIGYIIDTILNKNNLNRLQIVIFYKTNRKSSSTRFQWKLIRNGLKTSTFKENGKTQFEKSIPNKNFGTRFFLLSTSS